MEKPVTKGLETLNESTMQLIEEEVELIKGTFKDNEELLKIMRALFFGLSVSREEKDLIRSTFANKDLLKLMRKKFSPQIDRNAPMGQISDNWLGAESLIFGAMPSTIKQALEYKRFGIDLVQKALSLLENPDAYTISLFYDPKEDDELGTKLLGRNQYMRMMESQLLMLKVISDQKTETTQERMNRLAQDSAK